jgi:cytochrome c peroxidase
MKLKLLTAAIAASIGLAGCSSNDAGDKPALDTKEALGEKLFFDTNLSQNRTQSCATCHNPDRAFIDDRPDENGKIPAVSLGDDDTSLGDRNAPTAAYALISPKFGHETHPRFNSKQPDYVGFVGGQFLDGRELDLKGQAGGPPTNPIEMGMPDKASVVARIKENPDYIAAFKSLYEDTIFDDDEAAYGAMAQSIGNFEKTAQFAPFDSKYDRFLREEYTYNPASKAAAGKALFFSQQFTNCATCHQLHPNGTEKETFSNYEYHNLGVPANESIRLVNGKEAGFIDQGLLDNPAVSDEKEKGKYKVPTLRNVAVTEPYMHNGVFQDLKTVVEFYDMYLPGSEHLTNPETGAPWKDPEVPETVALTELKDAPKLTDEKVEHLVCFMRTLTDQRYEHLIQDKGIDCGE